MHKSITTLVFCLITFCLSAQVVEKDMNMSAGEQNGLEVDLTGNSKTSEKIWKEYTKPYGKVDWDRKNKEHVLFNVRVPGISSEEVTIVARFNQFRDMTKGSFWIKSGDEYLNSEDHGEAFRGTGEFLQEYAYEVERHSIREAIKQQEKDLDRLEKDLERLIKKNKNLHKDIEKAKEEIAKKEREIEENLMGQKSKKDEIENQRKTIQRTTVELTNVGKNT